MSAGLIRITQASLLRVEALLNRRIESSMFPLANLRDHGLKAKHPNAVTGWTTPEVDQALFITNKGMILPQLDPARTQDWAEVLNQRQVIGLAGATEQVRALIPVLGLRDAPTELDEDEPGLGLWVAQLRMPQAEGFTLRPLSDLDRSTAIRWRAMSQIETLGAPADSAEARAAVDIDTYCARDSHRVLFHGSDPVALTGFNASLPSIVQIGGVYTPRELRNRGYARVAVALHLQEVAAQGVQRAVLFAANAAAVRVYQALGFRLCGTFSLVLFYGPQEVRV